jgi:hypothetical protein
MHVAAYTLRPPTRNPLTAPTLLVLTSNSSMVGLLFWVNADLDHQISVQLAPSSLKRLMNPARLDQSIVSHRIGLQLGSMFIVAS